MFIIIGEWLPFPYRVCVPYLSLIVLTEKLQIEKKNINKINEKYQQQQI